MTDATASPPPAPEADDAPSGGDETTEEHLQADNPAEEDMIKALDPEAPTG
jgi:hypothetical protein